MKTKSYFVSLVLLGFLTWSCSNKDDLSSSQSLKVSMNTGAANLTTAMTAITASPGYQVLATTGASNAPSLVASSVSNGSFGMSRVDTISLSDIAGVYDYKAANYKRWHPDLLNFFVKSGTSSDFIVKLPASKVTHPGSLFHFAAADTLLVNNYVVDVSKYNYNFSRYLWNYSFASTITIDAVAAGSLSIESIRNRKDGRNFSSDFLFANGYDARVSYSSGDTIMSDYSISKAGTIYFEENFTSIKNDTARWHREKQYTLTIGNVKIVRTPTHGNNGLDSAKVYVNTVLQTKAKVVFIDINKGDTTEFSIIGHNRDLQITFDDGSVSTVSELLGSSIKNVRELFTSLRQVYFATNLVDWVAWDIAMNKNNMGMGHYTGK
jgi:hypothetical protein